LGWSVGTVRHQHWADILRAARDPQEDHHSVALALQSRRPGAVELNLTQEQYNKLKRD